MKYFTYEQTRTDYTAAINKYGVTLNNASDYRTNGRYWTPNPNPSPLARKSIRNSPLAL